MENTSKQGEFLGDLEEACIEANGEKIPEELARLLLEAKENCKDDDDDVVSDSDARKFIYKKLFDFLSREHKVGLGAALCYPRELLNAVRKLYPDGVKDYRPIAGKRKRLYEVSLTELLHEFKGKETTSSQ